MAEVVDEDEMTYEEKSEPVATPQTKAPHWAKKALLVKLRLVIAGIALGYLYGFASPLVYPKDRPLGFAHGFAHGGLMPMALPSLIIGKNVPIFAENNNGRFYKLGYICGINVCGLLFFGFGFGGLPKKGGKT
jgi:hypothetical protein